VSHPLCLGRLFDAIATALYEGGAVDIDFTDFSSVSEPAATACAPTAPSNEPGVSDDACSTVRDELQPFLKPDFLPYVFGLPARISGLDQG
jgi:hypothetical protein